jgi:hypothetical protein
MDADRGGKGKEPSNAEIYFQLGQLQATQTSILDAIRRQLELDEKRFAALERKTEKFGTVIAFAGGFAAACGAVSSFIIRRLFGS